MVPRKLLESETFNIKYQNPNLIPTTAEKLRYYRHTKALLQKEVAKKVGINQSTYIGYESTVRDYYPINILSKIANIYEIDVIDLLDDYNLFLYEGQSSQLKKFRKSLNLTQNEISKKLQVATRTFRQWEKGRVRISKNTYEKLFKHYELSS